HYSKQEILEMYLTQIYFGHGAYGIAAAASTYFNKSVEDLTLAESTLLAALPKAPTRYSPYFYPDRAEQRRNLILRGMLKVGVITAEEYRQAIATPLQLAERKDENSAISGAYFTEMVRQKLSDEGQRLGFDYLTDGLTVRTTLDARLQRFAERAVESNLGELQSVYRRRFIERERRDVVNALRQAGFIGDSQSEVITLRSLQADSLLVDSLLPQRSVVQAALVALDPKTGDILALIGGRDFVKSKFNRAVQAIRQPGSAFKPIAYTAAVDNGYMPTYQLLNQDVVVENPDGMRWVPENYDGSKGGLTTLREALRRSLNLVTVRLVKEIVPPAMVVKYAHQLGFTTPIAAVDAVGLGATGVIPLDAASVFAVFASSGIYNAPRSIFRIEDRFGEEIESYPTVRHVALAAETSYIITDMLRTAINEGTGASARGRFGFQMNAAGKTGTTNDFTDAWFIGFTPLMVCAVWVGIDDPAESLGKGQSGAVAALPIWAAFMKTVYDSLGWEDLPFERPPGVVELTICDDTKDLASPYCPVKKREIFRQDSQPLEICRKHRRLKGITN
ncbi:MAG: penicillin-binding transpeptidase domain-containing protein, partial [Calditrichota bacterium]